MVALGVRFVFRTLDLATLSTSSSLRRAYVQGWRGLPSPYRSSFQSALIAKERGLSTQALTYGEAFVCVAKAILRRHGATAGGVVVDLGCGRGNVLIAARALGATARGIELLPDHLAVVGEALRAAGVDVDVADARDAVVDDATHVWLSWATWDPEVRQVVTARLRSLKPGAVVVAVVWAVEDEAFEVLERSRAAFSWGFADVVVSRRIG
ncbi:MAG: class I SAM-dependent methyltransferase [Deltaproteobacteria bacterium]|nr:class I SAM-dependent methyltransferase [Deltaproteobacteria bacterium]